MSQVKSSHLFDRFSRRARFGFRSSPKFQAHESRELTRSKNLPDVFSSAFVFIRVIRGLLLDGDLIEDGTQLVEIHRFDQVKIESRFFAATDVLVCSEASESNGFDRLSPFCFGNYVIPSAVGKANVAQDDIEFL